MWDHLFSIKKDRRDSHGDINHIKGFFKTFLKKRHSMQEDTIGYIWKLEYGKKKGYHYHITLFLDGNKHHKDEILGDKFGKEWLKVTQGNGEYYNCNASKHLYRNLGIGMLHHDNNEAFITLMEVVVDYLVKVDQFVFLPHDKRGKTFGISQMPVSKRKSGRPRRET